LSHAIGIALPAGVAFPYRVSQLIFHQDIVVVGALSRTKASRPGPIAIQGNMGREFLFGKSCSQKMSDFCRFQPNPCLFSQKTVDFRVITPLFGFHNHRFEPARTLARLTLQQSFQLFPY
jgi:hypothetical protein